MRTLKFQIAIVLLVLPMISKGQDFGFSVILSPGDSMRSAGNLVGAVAAYKMNIESGKGRVAPQHSVDRTLYLTDLYNLGCTFSTIGQQDSAVKYITRYAMESNDSSDQALAEPELYQIRNAAAWNKLEDEIIKRYCASNKVVIKDMAYAKALWLFKAKDQAYYAEIATAEKMTGKSSSVVMAIWDMKKKLGAENQSALEVLIKAKGWPTISQVGSRAATAAFLVIQHADLTWQQQYLPIIHYLCKKSEARWQDYALMYDRVQTAAGKTQRYGSQVQFNPQTNKHELLPLEDASMVDEWRRDAGLQPLSEYLAKWQIKWP